MNKSHSNSPESDQNTDQRRQIEQLLSDVNDMINKIQSKKVIISEDLAPQVMQEIERLEETIAMFEDIAKEDFKEANIDIENLRTSAFQSPSLTDKDKRILEKVKNVEKEVKTVQYQVVKALEKASQAVKNTKTATSKGIKDRRNRFKPIGGNKNWIPL